MAARRTGTSDDASFRAASPVLGLDVGTSSVRLIAYDAQTGRSWVCARDPYGTQGEGRPLNVQTVWLRVARTLDAAERALAQSHTVVRAVGISVFWHSLYLAAPDGEPRTPLYLWNDPAPAFGQGARELGRRVDAEAVRQAVGAPFHPSFPPAKLISLLAGRGDRHEVRVCGFEDVLTRKLFARSEKSLSMATGTGLWHLSAGGWHRGLLAALDLAPSQFPQVVSTKALSPQSLAGDAARRWPHLAQASWLLPVGDGALSNLGMEAIGPILGLTIGTSAALRCLMPEGDAPSAILPRALFRYALDARRQVVGGALSSGGNLLARMERRLGVSAGALDAQIDRLEPGSGDVLVIPYFWGERSPNWRADAHGAVIGVRSSTRPDEVLRAAMDAIGAGLWAIREALAGYLKPTGSWSVRAGGQAITALSSLAQIAADALDMPVAVLSGAEESSARGAASAALGASGELPLPVLDGEGRTFVPRPGRSKAYAALLRRLEAHACHPDPS